MVWVQSDVRMCPNCPAITRYKTNENKKGITHGLFCFWGISQKMLHLNGLELVEDGTGELVGGGLAAHVGSADLAMSLLVDAFF